jgi:hypothetical protein
MAWALNHEIAARAQTRDINDQFGESEDVLGTVEDAQSAVAKGQQTGTLMC